MFKHFLNTARRHFRKDWLYTIINVVGLALGLALVSFIILYVGKEYSWNKNHQFRNSSYRILVTNPDWTEPLSAYSLGPALVDDLPEVEASSRIGGPRAYVLFNDNQKKMVRAYGADPGVFNIFSLKILRGDPDNLLKNKEEALISRELAEVIFGDENPLGKELRLTGNDFDLSLSISGVFENQPENSTFRPDVIYSSIWAAEYYGKIFRDSSYMTNFRTGSFQNYYRLKEGISQKDFESKLKLLEEKYYDPDWNLSLGSQKVSDIYLTSGDLANARTAVGDPRKIKVFSLIAILVLLIATFNYIILASARSASRFREIGLRKVCGASRKIISMQVFGESLITALIAFPISLIIVAVFLPNANQVLNANMEFKPLEMPWIIPGFFTVCILVGLISGLYLAIYLSRLRPVEIFRSRGGIASSRSFLYKILVTLQILIFISLFSCSQIILKQVRYAQDLDQGFDRENLLIIYVDMDQFPEYEAFAQEIRKFPSVINAGISMGGPPTESRGIRYVNHFKNPDEKVSVENLNAGGQYMETMGFRLISGRFIDEGSESDRTGALVINETGVRELGIEGDPIGQELNGKPIIGVIQDFYVHSVKSKISPLTISYYTKYCYEVSVRVKEGQLEQALDQIEQTWKTMAPDAKFEAREFDEAVAALYSREKDFAFIIMGLTGLAIFIAALGLFGLSLLMANKRTREIGIRKIHGASRWLIVMTINRAFVMYTLAAFLISLPLSIWIIKSWLKNFEYQTALGIIPFIVSGVLALLVVILTITYHSLRSARMNPADIVRHE